MVEVVENDGVEVDFGVFVDGKQEERIEMKRQKATETINLLI